MLGIPGHDAGIASVRSSCFLAVICRLEAQARALDDYGGFGGPDDRFQAVDRRGPVADVRRRRSGAQLQYFVHSFAVFNIGGSPWP
jgi:hypothetical protein